MLKEEVEEMKATLNCTEEGRARASAHSKHVVSKTEAAVMCCTVSCSMKASTVVNLIWIQSEIPFFFLLRRGKIRVSSPRLLLFRKRYVTVQRLDCKVEHQSSQRISSAHSLRDGLTCVHDCKVLFHERM